MASVRRVVVAALLLFASGCTEEPYQGGCIGDMEDCRAAATYVQQHWPAGSHWDSPGSSVRIGDVHEVVCDESVEGYGFGGDGCFYVSVFDGVRNGSVYVRVEAGEAVELLDPWHGREGYPQIRTPEPDDEAGGEASPSD